MADEEQDTGINPAEETEIQAEAEPVETQEQEASPDAGAQAHETEPKTPGVQKRINDLTRNWREAERERDHWREQALKSTAQEAPPAPVAEQPVPTQAPKRPTEEQFDYDPVKYQEAVAKYDDDWLEYKLAQRDAQRQQQETQKRQQEEQQRDAQTFAEKRDATVKAGTGKYADFEEVVFSLPGDVMTQNVASAVFAASAPDDVAYYLGKNPEEAAAIAKLHPVQQAVKIGAIDTKLGLAAAKKTTAAPPPPPKFDGAGGGPVDVDRLAKDNPREFIRLRNEGKI